MRILALILFSMTCLDTSAQSFIKPRNLQVTLNKTTNLIFPTTISSIDRGSEQIVVQKSTDNILRVKADSVFADTTNLTVITLDGKLYSFLVSYSMSPVVLNLDLGATDFTFKDTALFALAERALKFKNNLHGIRFSSGKVKCSIVGLYSTGEMLVCKLRIENSSALSFEAGRMRCWVASTHTARRMPAQELAVEPLLVHPYTQIIKEKQAMTCVLILPKAGLGEGQALRVDLTEKGGARQLTIKVSNKHILKSVLIK